MPTSSLSLSRASALRLMSYLKISIEHLTLMPPFFLPGVGGGGWKTPIGITRRLQSSCGAASRVTGRVSAVRGEYYYYPRVFMGLVAHALSAVSERPAFGNSDLGACTGGDFAIPSIRVINQVARRRTKTRRVWFITTRRTERTRRTHEFRLRACLVCPAINIGAHKSLIFFNK